MKTTLMALMAAGLLLPLTASAMEWTIHGAVKNEAAYFVSGDKRLDKVQNRLDLIPEAILSARWEFRGRFLGWYDAASDLVEGNDTDLTPSIQNEYRTYSAVKEAYLLYAADDYDLRLGQQQVVWGKTDGLRLLDIVNPLDMREFLMDDFLDSREGVVAARLNYYTYLDGREHEFEFLYIPDAKVAKFSPKGSRWAYAMPQFPAGLTPVFKATQKPSFSAIDAEYGAAWRANIDGWDVSLNWFYGWKDTPVLNKEVLAGKVYVTPTYQQMNTVGGSFSNAFGAFVLRSELAVNLSERLAATTAVRETDTWNVAIGLDYNQNNWRISQQVFVRHLQGWDKTIIEEKNTGFVSLIVSTDYMNDKLKLEIMMLANWSDYSTMIRPKVSYALSDAVVAKVGADFFSGNTTAFFGQFDQNDRVYTEVEYTF